MDLKDYRKSKREKRKVFKLHMLIAMTSLAISFVLLIFDINFGFDMTFFVIAIYFMLSIVFDKEYRRGIIDFLKKITHNKVQNDNRG